MKKKILYFFLLLLFGLLFTYVFRYKLKPCLCDIIPHDAKAVVYLNLRNIEQHFLHDFIYNPSSYLKRNKISKDTLVQDVVPRRKVKIGECIEIPKGLILYSTDEKKEIWRSSWLELKSKETLLKLLEELGFRSDKSGGLETFKRRGFLVVFNNEKVRLEYNGGRDSIKEESVEEENKFLSTRDSLFEAINESSNDILYVDNAGQYIALNFETGSVFINGIYDIDILGKSTEINESKALGQLSAKLNPEKLSLLLDNEVNKKFSDFVKLNMDSLLINWDGSLNIVLNDFKTIADTITTYEYDDDFNKVEIEKIEEMRVPDFNVRMGMSKQGTQYMWDKKAIVEENRDTVLAIFPLVRTLCQSSDSFLDLYTSYKDVSLNPSKLKLALSLDVEKYNILSEESVYFMGDISSVIKHIKASISDDNEINIRITTKSNRNSLVSIIKN